MIAIVLLASLAQDGIAPFSEGATWTYAAEGREYTRKVLPAERLEDKDYLVLEDDALPEGYRRMYVEATGDGLRVVRFEKKLSEPFLLIPTNLKPDAAWEAKVQIGRFEKVELTWACRVEAEEQVTVGDQKYQTWRVATQVTADGTPVFTMTSWYAPQIAGDVKREITVGAKKLALTLKRFLPGAFELSGFKFAEHASGGYRVVRVKPGSLAIGYGLRDGDILKMVNGKKLTFTELKTVANMLAGNGGEADDLTVDRQGTEVTLSHPPSEEKDD